MSAHHGWRENGLRFPPAFQFSDECLSLGGLNQRTAGNGFQGVQPLHYGSREEGEPRESVWHDGQLSDCYTRAERRHQKLCMCERVGNPPRCSPYLAPFESHFSKGREGQMHMLDARTVAYLQRDRDIVQQCVRVQLRSASPTGRCRPMSGEEGVLVKEPLSHRRLRLAQRPWSQRPNDHDTRCHSAPEGLDRAAGGGHWGRAVSVLKHRFITLTVALWPPPQR